MRRHFNTVDTVIWKIHVQDLVLGKHIVPSTENMLMLKCCEIDSWSSEHQYENQSCVQSVIAV